MGPFSQTWRNLVRFMDVSATQLNDGNNLHCSEHRDRTRKGENRQKENNSRTDECRNRWEGKRKLLSLLQKHQHHRRTENREQRTEKERDTNTHKRVPKREVLCRQ